MKAARFGCIMKYDVIIIGGGASGLVAAIEAKKTCSSVCIIEKEERVGRKIPATGNGKCNLSNTKATVKDYHGSFSYSVKELYSDFTSGFLPEYFYSLGLFTFADEKGRVYPRCKQASSVLDVLRNRIYTDEIVLVTNTKVIDIEQKNGFTVRTDSQNNFTADKLIIACGGKSSPNLGSDGSMYSIIKKLGHSLTPLKPALCPINVKSDVIKSLKGVRVDGKLTAMRRGKAIKYSFGEIQFTENSVSGICAFDLSYLDFDTVRVSLMPDNSREEIIGILKDRRILFAENRIDSFFMGMFNNKISVALLKTAKLGSFNRQCNDISNKEISTLAELINKFDFPLSGSTDYSRSQVTAGGVNGHEIDPRTLESLIVPDLYFCGEVIDIDGICVGYNLRFAFTSGIRAGQLL